ncbi:MAG: YjbQ family protein [Rhodospirillales bacterium]|nr:YjbQ family protein [Rhodospirillales bacterium]
MADDIIVHCDSVEIALETGPAMADVSPHISQVVAASGVRDGSVQLSAVGSTASLTTIEYEPGAIEDLKRAILRLAPPNMEYMHELTWHDGNGHSHVQAALLGPSLYLPIRGGRMRLGTWQQVVLINHDNRPRQRELAITVIGRG